MNYYKHLFLVKYLKLSINILILIIIFKTYFILYFKNLIIYIFFFKICKFSKVSIANKI